MSACALEVSGGLRATSKLGRRTGRHSRPRHNTLMPYLCRRPEEMLRTLFTFSLAVGVCASAIGAPFTSFGAPDCGQWVNSPSLPRKGWLLGFMSGLSAQHADFRPSAKDPLDRVSSADQIYVWMDNYCKANPLKSVSNAGLELFDELRSQSK